MFALAIHDHCISSYTTYGAIIIIILYFFRVCVRVCVDVPLRTKFTEETCDKLARQSMNVSIVHYYYYYNYYDIINTYVCI